MTTRRAEDRIADRKRRERESRGAQIVQAARRVAEAEGWQAVTVRRLAEEIAYSQPVLYGHFGSREGILAAVAVEGFGELGEALERARTEAGGTDGASAVERVARAYLQFARASPALYEVMFSLRLEVAFGEAATPEPLQFAFTQVALLFREQGARAEVLAELLWASLHGLADLARTGRLPPERQAERVRTLAAVWGGGAEERT